MPDVCSTDPPLTLTRSPEVSNSLYSLSRRSVHRMELVNCLSLVYRRSGDIRVTVRVRISVSRFRIGVRICRPVPKWFVAPKCKCSKLDVTSHRVLFTIIFTISFHVRQSDLSVSVSDFRAVSMQYRMNGQFTSDSQLLFNGL